MDFLKIINHTSLRTRENMSTATRRTWSFTSDPPTVTSSTSFSNDDFELDDEREQLVRFQVLIWRHMGSWGHKCLISICEF